MGSKRHGTDIPSNTVLVDKDEWDSVRSALSAIYQTLLDGEEISLVGRTKQPGKRHLIYSLGVVNAMKQWAGDCLILTFKQDVPGHEV